MSIEISYFQKFEFISYRQKGSFELIISEEELDEFFTFNEYWDVNELTKKIGLNKQFITIVPYIHSFSRYLSHTDKEELEKLLIHPEKCLKLNDELKLFDKILEINPEYSVYLNSVLNNWKKNRYVIVHYE